MSQNNPENDIDIAQIGNKFKDFYNSIQQKIYNFIEFIIKNIVFLFILIIIGGVLGYLADNYLKTYENKVILSANLGSYDMLNDKINLINAKISEGDTLFIKSIGINNPTDIGIIKMTPVLDFFNFAERPSNFELIKLMAEDIPMEKIMKDEVTVKNFPNHLISFRTAKPIAKENVINPLLKYFNDNEYFRKIHQESLKNIDIKIIENDSLIKQIDDILEIFKSSPTQAKSQSLVFYNENTQLNELINTKNGLIAEKAKLNIDKIALENIVRESSIMLNAEYNKGIHGKLKLIFPFLFVIFFLLIIFVKKWYISNKQKNKLS